MKRHQQEHAGHHHGTLTSPAAPDEAYRQAYDAAQLDPGRRVISVVLEPSEVERELLRF